MCRRGSTVDRQASHGSDEEASGLSSQKTLGSIHISIIQNITSYWLAEEANISSLVASYLWNRRLESLATRTPHSSEPLCDEVERTLWLVGRVAWLRLSTLTVSSGECCCANVKAPKYLGAEWRGKEVKSFTPWARRLRPAKVAFITVGFEMASSNTNRTRRSMFL